MDKNIIKNNSFFKIIAVLLGVFGAGYLFNVGWQGVFDFITSYRFGENFFDHFFNTGLFPVLTLAISLLYLIVSLKDLESLSKGFAIFTSILSAVVFCIFIFRFVNFIKDGYILNYGFLLLVSELVLIIAYLGFSIFIIKGTGLSKITWICLLISIVILLAAIIWGYIVKSLSATEFVKYILNILSHISIFLLLKIRN